MPAKAMWLLVALQTSETSEYGHTYIALSHLFAGDIHHCTDTANVADATDCHSAIAR